MANWWETPGYDMSRDAVVRGGVRPPDTPPGWWDEMLGPDRWSPSRGLAMPGEGVATVTISEPPPREPWPVRFAGDMWETAKALPGVMIDAATLPGDVMAGRIDPNSDDALARVNDLAGVVTLKAGAIPGGGLRAGLDRTKTGWTFRDVASPNRDLTKADNRRISNYVGVREEVVPIRSLYATQEKVNPDFASTETSAGELPFVIRKNGKLYLQDGHHRVTKVADQGGQNVRVRFMDLDQSDTSAPLLDWKPMSARDKAMVDDLLAELSVPDHDTLTAGGPGGRVAGAAELAGASDGGSDPSPIDWRALTDWLAEQPGAVSRDALAEAAERYSTGDIPRRADGGRTSKFRERIMKTGRPSKNVQDMRASQAAKINIAGKGNRELSRPDMLRELMRPESIVDRPIDDMSGGWPWPSPEWQGGMYPRQDQIYPAVPSGLIRDATPGRTDRLPMSLPSDTYVVPADVVSGLGQGNTEAGGRLLDAMFRDHKSAGGRLRASGGRASSSPVQIIAAGGEYLIDPEVVYSLGKGDPDKGHKELDKWVRATRQRVVNHMTKLPGPRKD